MPDASASSRHLSRGLAPSKGPYLMDIVTPSHMRKAGDVRCLVTPGCLEGVVLSNAR